MREPTLILVLVLFFAWSANAKLQGSKNEKKLSNKKSIRYGSLNPEVNRRLAGIARQMLRQSEWGDLAVLSAYWETFDYPFVTPKMFAEGNSTFSTGKPHFFLSPKYYVTSFLERTQKVSFTITLEQSGACRKKGLNVQNNECYFVIFNGNFTKFEKNSQEYKIGYQYLSEKYPEIDKIPNKDEYIIGAIRLIDVMIVAGKEELECIPLDAYFITPPNEHFENELESHATNDSEKKRVKDAKQRKFISNVKKVNNKF